MNTSANRILELPWVVALLNLWLTLSQPRRHWVVMPLVLFSALLFSIWQLNLAATRQVSPTTSENVIQLSVQPHAHTRPDTLSSHQLYELTQAFDSISMSQQRDTFNLNFTTHWRSFAEFSNQIARSSLAPQSYRIFFNQAVHDALLFPRTLFNVEMQLSPGYYRAASSALIPIGADPDEGITAMKSTVQHCVLPPLPGFAVQASWPSRGYIQVLFETRSERIAVGQVIENSWQLLRISSDSLEFGWHSASPGCPQLNSVTVAI